MTCDPRKTVHPIPPKKTTGPAIPLELSVIIVTLGCYEPLRKTMTHLRAQTKYDRIEIIIVIPSAADFSLEEAEGFSRVQVIECGPFETTGKPRAIGISHASAPIIAMGEDHVYPDTRWAEALIATHQQTWAVVGPAIANANPDSAVSWAHFLIGYSHWFAPREAGAVEILPGHNSSYKRTLLMEYGTALEHMLEREGDLNQDLQAKGHRFYLDTDARVEHLNFSRWFPFIKNCIYRGRLFSTNRVQREQWSVFRCLAYIIGTPLIPAMHLRRLIADIMRSERKYRLLVHVLPTLLVGLAFVALGEAVGYAWGEGKAAKWFVDVEFDRSRFLNNKDRRLMGNGS